MEFWAIIVIALQITAVVSKKKHRLRDSEEFINDSGDSIESLLYYKDSSKKTVQVVPTQPPKPACPCPRVACSRVCECEPPTPFMNRPPMPPKTVQLPPLPGEAPIPRFKPLQTPVAQHPKISPLVTKKTNMISPIGARRNYGFTREDIKNLISHDQDIKKILNELVQVTMQKASLAEMEENQGNGADDDFYVMDE